MAGEKAPALESYKQGLGYNSKDEQLQAAVNRLQRGESQSNGDPAVRSFMTLSAFVLRDA